MLKLFYQAVKWSWTYYKCQHIDRKTRGAHTLHKLRRSISSQNYMAIGKKVSNNLQNIHIIFNLSK